ncbi:MAG: ADP-ribosylglycohydrolase family protein [Bacteroidia bacterium]
MIVEGAIGDAYGAGFEFADRAVIEAHNNLSGYIPHPVYASINQKYTDDTQMAVALVELILSGNDWNSLNIANAFVTSFKRDPREGYARRFYAFLTEIETGQDLLDKIISKSERNGAAMRAYPLGALHDIQQIKEWSRIQAEVTHQTQNAVVAAEAIALISHFFIYDLGTKEELLDFVRNHTGHNWAGSWKTEVETNAIQTVEAVLDIMISGKKLSQMLIDSVNLGGDVDTVASLVLAIGSASKGYENDLPQNLYDDLENDKFGRDYLIQLDQKWASFVQDQLNNRGAFPQT